MLLLPVKMIIRIRLTNNIPYLILLSIGVLVNVLGIISINLDEYLLSDLNL